jgi:hypothetical protein
MTKRKTYKAKFSNGEVIRRQTVTARVYVRLRIKPFGAVRLWVFRRCSVFRLSGTNDGSVHIGEMGVASSFWSDRRRKSENFCGKSDHAPRSQRRSRWSDGRRTFGWSAMTSRLRTADRETLRMVDGRRVRVVGARTRVNRRTPASGIRCFPSWH